MGFPEVLGIFRLRSFTITTNQQDRFSCYAFVPGTENGIFIYIASPSYSDFYKNWHNESTLNRKIESSFLMNSNEAYKKDTGLPT
jgi:hypothetical protein